MTVQINFNKSSKYNDVYNSLKKIEQEIYTNEDAVQAIHIFKNAFKNSEQDSMHITINVPESKFETLITELKCITITDLYPSHSRQKQKKLLLENILAADYMIHNYAVID